MSGNPLRKMKRTKREQAMMMENMNRQAISNILEQLKSLHEGEQKLLNYLAFLQREMLGIKSALMRRGLITELEVQQELSKLDEMAKMEAMALDLSGAASEDQPIPPSGE